MCMISKCNLITVKGYFVMAVTGAKIVKGFHAKLS